jgi:hypothetical protein
MLGLTDAHIARRRTARFGRGLQGHELGDGNYVLERGPDIIIAGILGSETLSYVGGKEMEADPRFADWYRPANFRAEDPVPLSFVTHIRLEGRVGLERSTAEIRIPGYLFANTDGAEARFDSSGKLGTAFTKTLSVALTKVKLPSGVWPPRVPVRSRCRC